MSDPVRIGRNGSVHTGRAAVPVLEDSLKRQSAVIADSSPLDGALRGAVLPGMVGGVAMVASPLFWKAERSWGAVGRNAGATGVLIGAGMASGFAGEAVKSLLMARGANAADASRNGHLIAGLGVGTAMLGASKFIPAGSPFRIAAAMGGALAGVTGLLNATAGHSVSQLEDKLERAKAS